MENYGESTKKRLVELLDRLVECSPPLNSAWCGELLSLSQIARQDCQSVWALLNHKHIWGGANSLASQALNGNDGLSDAEWQMRIREFRDVMIELGELLRLQGRAYPDIQAWLLAFHNWNNANV